MGHADVSPTSVHLDAMSRLATGGCPRTRKWAVEHVEAVELLVADLERLRLRLSTTRLRVEAQRAEAFAEQATIHRAERRRRRHVVAPAAELRHAS
jgi:hypothetical protein